MSNNFEIFFSNQLDVLYERLKHSLFSPHGSNAPFMKRIVVVYGPAMKTWLMLKMAQDIELKVAFGIEFIYLNHSFEYLLKLTTSAKQLHIPSLLELTFAIETVLKNILKNFKTLSTEDQNEWRFLVNYLKLPEHQLIANIKLTRKMQRRLIGLSQHLARLFQDYGRYAPDLTQKWEISNGFIDWQGQLWRQIFMDGKNWTYPAKALVQKGQSTLTCSVHFFSISFISQIEFNFLNRLSESLSLNYYLLSPCAVFWSDIRSDRERASLQTYLHSRGLGSKFIELEKFLRDRNPLLANFGRLGREMACQIEESHAVIKASYLLPHHVQELNLDVADNDDFYFIETKNSLTLLHALQTDLLTMRNLQGLPQIDLKQEDKSIQLHVTSCKRREVEVLYQNLLGIISADRSISPSDIIVMAPQITDYVPYIHSRFGNKESQFDFQILDLGLQTQNELVQGFLQLIQLGESDWNAFQLLKLFEHPSFQRRHGLSSSDLFVIKKWIERTRIYWGEDLHHRDEILERRHCKNGMIEKTAIGTWNHGLTRLLYGLAQFEENSLVDFSQSDLLGKWIALIHSLRDDLLLFHDETEMSVNDWINFLNCILENYFQADLEKSDSVQEFEEMKKNFEMLRIASRSFPKATFSFESVKTNLINLLNQGGIVYRENHFESVRFCSLTPLRSIPAKVIAILGLQEDSFPRLNHPSSLNKMTSNEFSGYYPSSNDHDRYLFLEAVHSAQDFFLLSYQTDSQKDGKEKQPSIAVQELFSYLDQFYLINGEKITSKCIYRHPFDSFDSTYFLAQSPLVNFSQIDFKMACIINNNLSADPHRFVNQFSINERPLKEIIANQSQIDLKHLTAVARNPIKFHLNKVLEIHLQTDEDRKLKIDEDLTISALNKYLFKQQSLKEPLDKVLNKAERDGKLPMGIFKDVATRRLKYEVEDIHKCLKRHSIHQNDFFQIDFSSICTTPTQIDDSLWLFPAPKLLYEKDFQLSIEGNISNITSKGFVALNKLSLSDLWKIWPEFLMYSHAVKLCPEQLESQLISAVSTKSKKTFFNDPDKYLKQFVQYYSLCVQNFSPLMPDWLTFILSKDKNGLEEKLKQLFTDSFDVYKDHYLKWIFNPSYLIESSNLIDQWNPIAQELLSEITENWF